MHLNVESIEIEGAWLMVSVSGELSIIIVCNLVNNAQPLTGSHIIGGYDGIYVNGFAVNRYILFF